MPPLSLLCTAAFAQTEPGATHTSWSLDYSVSESLQSSCPDESRFRESVASRIGRDPFRAAAAPDTTQPFGSMTIAFDSVAAGARARLQVSRQLGETGARPSRVLEGHVTDCMGLADAIALSAAVVIEPSITTRPTTTATPTDVAPAQIETEVSPPVAPTVGHLDATPPSDAGPHERAPDSGDGLGFALRGAVDFDAWLAPTATFGGSVGFALRSKAWSLELGGLFLLPVATAQTLSSDRFAASVYAGTARGCARFGAIAPCVGLLAGSMVARATTVSDPIDRVLPLVALLARIEASLDLTDHIALIGGAELVIPLTKAELLIGPRAIWTSSAISLHISLGIEARFANGPL